jgi:hypothetical protein
MKISYPNILLLEASYLALLFIPTSIESSSLISFLLKEVTPYMGRRKKPSTQLHQALGMIVAAFLKEAAIRPEGYLFRSMGRDSFKDNGLTGRPVGYRPFRTVVDGLKEKGYLEVVTGFKESTNIHDQGVATRFRVTPK